MLSSSYTGSKNGNRDYLRNKIKHTVELSIEISAHDIPQVAALLERFGQGGATIEEWPETENAPEKHIIKIYLPHTRYYKARILQIARELENSTGYRERDLRERVITQEDWFAYVKQQFNTLDVGEKITIKATWAEVPPSSTRQTIELDPGYAFGTGLHPTTRLCLVHLEKQIQPRMTVLDLGTGSGILAIAAAKLGAASVLARDTDPVAVYAAKNNVAANSVANIVRVQRGTLSRKAQIELKDTFELVVANITAPVIARLADGFTKILKPEGTLIVSGISAPGLDEVLIRLALADLKIENIYNDGEWYAVIARRIKR
jgi:ribosomal protein L11 methyltransferase